MLGNFHDDVINIECETSSADLYVVDAEGVYIENIAMHSYLESDVIDAINAKYGTNFTNLTMQKVTGIAIGDDCPNWNAYEKIEMPPTIYAKITPQGSSLWTIGKILGNTFKILCQNDEGAWQVTNDGKINGVFGHPYDLMSYMWAPKLQQAGYEISAFEIELVAYNVGDTIDNWDDFIEL